MRRVGRCVYEGGGKYRTWEGVWREIGVMCVCVQEVCCVCVCVCVCVSETLPPTILVLL